MSAAAKSYRLNAQSAMIQDFYSARRTGARNLLKNTAAHTTQQTVIVRDGRTNRNNIVIRKEREMRAHLDNIKITDTSDMGIATKISDRGYKQTDYQADEYERSSDVKNKQRENVLNFILDNHSNFVNPKYIGLPGKFWLFERMLERENQCANFTGFESNYQIYGKSVGYIPGSHLISRRLILTSPSLKSFRINISRTSKAYYINGDLKSMTEDLAFKEAESRGPYFKALINRSCAWLDFTSPLTVGTYTTIYNLHNVLNPRFDTPVCITLQYGRDQFLDGKNEAGRINVIEKALPRFECKDVSVYKGYKNTPMITIFGINASSPEGELATSEREDLVAQE